MIEIPADAFVIDGSFGRLVVFTLDRADKATPKNRVVAGEAVFTLGHTQPFSLKGRLRPFLEKLPLGRIVAGALADNERAFIWSAPSGLAVSSLLVADKKAVLAPAVDEALAAMAERLASEIDAPALTELARSVIGVTETEHDAGFIRPAAEWEALNELATSDDFRAALRGLAPFARLGNGDLARALGALVVRVPERRLRVPPTIEDPEGWLRYAAVSYEEDEFVVKASYRAVSKLVAQVALSMGVPALQDAERPLPTLSFEGDAITASRAVAALCITNMRLVRDDGSCIAQIAEPVTCLVEGWPDRLSQLDRSWAPARRKRVRAAAAAAGIESLSAICPVVSDELLKLAASSPQLVVAVLVTFADREDHPLNWRRHVSDAATYRTVLDTGAYTKAVLLAIAAENGAGAEGEAAAQLETISERLGALAQKLETIFTRDLAEVQALGAERKIIDAIDRPLQAAVAAMRAATATRLARSNAQVELMLSALVAANPRTDNDERTEDEQ